VLSLLGLQIFNFPSDRFNKTARQFASLVETTKITGKITVRAMTRSWRNKSSNKQYAKEKVAA